MRTISSASSVRGAPDDHRRRHVRGLGFPAPLRDQLSVTPVQTTASGGSGGTYAVTCRPPSYSNVSVTSSPAIGSTKSGFRRRPPRSPG